MAKRNTARRRSTNQHAPRQSQKRRSTRNAASRQASGERTYVREYAAATNKKIDEVARYTSRNNYPEMLDNAAALARQNMAATFRLGIATGLLTTEFARRWTAIFRKS
jgi:hypothetical protein